MRYLILFFIAAVLLFSCKESVTKLSTKIIDSDSMAINWFKGDGSMDTVVAVKIIKDKNAINTLAKLAGGYVTSKNSCGYDGSLHFFKMNQVIQDVRFRFTDAQCAHFEFIIDNKPYQTALYEDAVKVLESLRH